MSPKPWSTFSKNEGEDGFELLENNNSFNAYQSSTSDSIQQIWAAPTSALPAKNLRLQSTTHVVRSAFWMGVLVAILIIGLSLLADNLHHFKPYPYFDDIELKTAVSCDLTISQGSAFQSAFIIDLRGATHLSFSQAKAIDAIWQLFVGMGGRLMMAWMSYIVFMDGLTRLMENSPISYNLYASLTFTTSSLYATWYALRSVFYMKGWRSKAFLLWFAVSTLYVLGFPTLVSATGGYLTPSTAGFNMTDGSFVTPNSDQLRTCYQLNDGALIGYTNGSIIQGPPISVYNPYSIYYKDSSYGSYDDIQRVNNSFEDPSFRLKGAEPLYNNLTRYLFRGPHIKCGDSESFPYSFLDSSSSSSSGCEYYYQDYNMSFTLNNKEYIFHNYNFFVEGFSTTYCYNNRSIDDLAKLAQCFPEDYFVWGLSSLMVYIVLSIQMVWIFGMYIVWLDARIYSALCRSGRKIRGPFRAAADLSEAVREILGDQTCAYTDGELAQELDRQPGLRYYSNDAEAHGVSHIGLSSRRLGKVPYNSTQLYGKGGNHG